MKMKIAPHREEGKDKKDITMEKLRISNCLSISKTGGVPCYQTISLREKNTRCFSSTSFNNLGTQPHGNAILFCPLTSVWFEDFF